MDGLIKNIAPQSTYEPLDMDDVVLFRKEIFVQPLKVFFPNYIYSLHFFH